MVVTELGTVVVVAAVATVVVVVLGVVLVTAAADQRAYKVTSVLPVGVKVVPSAVPPVVEVNQPSNWWPAFVGAAGRVIAEPLRNVESGIELPPSSS